MIDPEKASLEELLQAAETLARVRSDGHLTILRFTSEWKCTFGTPDLTGGGGRQEVAALSGYPSLKHALIALLR